MDLTHIMTPNPMTIEVGATVAEALDLLQSLDVRHLPVVEDGTLVGMISDRDIQGLALATTGGEIEALAAGNYLDQTIGSIMSGDVQAASASDDVGDVIDLMIEHKIGALPVVDHAGHLVGILSYIDVLQAFRDEL